MTADDVRWSLVLAVNLGLRGERFEDDEVAVEQATEHPPMGWAKRVRTRASRVDRYHRVSKVVRATIGDEWAVGVKYACGATTRTAILGDTPPADREPCPICFRSQHAVDVSAVATAIAGACSWK
jgi:hypothetical protein